MTLHTVQELALYLGCPAIIDGDSQTVTFHTDIATLTYSLTDLTADPIQ